MSKVAETIREVLAASELEFVEHRPGVFEVELPGTRKQKTTCRLEVGQHALSVHAFVARHPDENFEGVYRWLLEKNLRLFGVAFAIDHLGDIYLDGRIALQAVTAQEVDRVLGSVLTYADESFNSILELGFSSAIKKEWEWREARGESTRNLEAFEHLRPSGVAEPGESP